MRNRGNCPKKDLLYSDICFICNTAAILFMTVAAGVLITLITHKIGYAILTCPILFWIFAWIVEHYLSEFINIPVGKIMKIDHTSKGRNSNGQ